MKLNEAAFRNDHELVEKILDEGNQPDSKTLCNLIQFYSRDPELLEQNQKLVKRVLELGVDPNEEPYEGHGLPVDLAAARPNSDTLRYLLSVGAKADPGLTVHTAIRLDYVDNLHVLVEFDVDMTTPHAIEDPEYARTPLEFAKDEGARKCSKLLRKILKDRI